MGTQTHDRKTDRPETFGKVVVLMGGRSAEREISLLSGGGVLAALQRSGVDVHAIDTGETDAMEQVRAGGFDRAFIALHGRGGEDGVMQGALELIGLPYTGSGVLGSALAMDKIRSKQVWAGTGIPTPAFHVLTRRADLAQVPDALFPLMIKPAHEGSSIGMARVENRDQLESAWEQAAQFDSQVLAEQWIEGEEYTAAVLGRRVLPMIRLETPRTFYDYEAKYQADSTRYICPCGLSEEREAALAEQVMQAFDAVGASGWGRVDFMMDAQGRPWMIEVNTVPGMTGHSLVPMAARVAGIEFDALVWAVLETSLETGREIAA